MVLPAPGSPAPDFTLPSTDGAQVTLSGLRGRKVLLAFFPLAFTTVCTAELCAMTDDYSAFEGTNTLILPISVDSVPTLKEYKAKEHLKLEMLSDFKREVSRLYGTLMDDRFYSNRAYVLIDENGIVRWAHAEATPSSRRENQEILEEIRKVG
ncbi:MAG: redoxin domain-containing protein [Gemmatimonadota bacterium]